MSKTNKHLRSIPRALALEPRLLFDGAAAIAATDSVDMGRDALTPQTEAQKDTAAAETRPGEAIERGSVPGILVVIDARVADYQSLLADLPANITVRVIQSGESGLNTIGTELAKGKFEAIHILSHGTPGSLAIGNDVINEQSLADAQNAQAEALQSWAAHLDAGADILLYGCDIAQGERGQAFVAELARLTGADVAASTDATGSAAKGGNWTLENRTGSIEAASPFSEFALAGYGELLANPRVESIVRQTPTAETTNATSVKFLVTFSESVSGVSADSFVIAPGSISGATVQLVTEVKDSSGKQYEVTIGNLNGAGSLNIDIAANNVIKNGNSLGMTDLTSSSGRDDSYTIDTLINKAVVQGIGTGSVSGQNILTSTAGGYLLNGIADRGDVVRIYIDGALVGTTTAHATTGAWSLTTTATALSVGNHTLVVRSSDVSGNLINSDAYTLTVDNTVPVLDLGASKVDDRIIELKFDRDLTAGTVTSDSSGLGFTVKVNGNASADTRVIRVDVVGSIVRLTLAKDVASTDTVTVSYDSGVAGSAAIKSAAGNVVSTILEATLAANDTKALDSAPVVNSLGNPTWYSKGDPAVAVFDSTSLALTDADDSYLEGAVVTIKTNHTAGDALTINNAASGTLASGIAWNYDSATGKLALSGHALLADYKAALSLVRFSATGGISAVSANVDRVVSLTVNDGQKDSAEVVRTMRVLGSAFSTGETTAAYVVQTNATSTGLQVINLVTGEVTKEMNLTGISSSSNALAFSPVDGHLYVSDNTNYKILRINADGTVTDMSAKYRTDGGNNSWQPEQKSNSVISGDIDASGIMYLNDLNAAKVIYRFDTNPASANYGKWLEPLTLKISGTEIAPRWTDMAVSPVNEGGKYYIYAVGGNTSTSTTTANGSYLYKIDPSDGTVVQIGAIKLADASGNRTITNPNGSSSGYPMQYFDQNGYFYFTAGNTSNSKVSIYRVDTTAASPDGKTTAVELKFDALTFPTTGDAARIVTIKLDYGDAPDTYFTTLEKDGARHSQVGNKVWLGNNISDEKIASPGGNANSDQYDDGVDIAGSGILRRGVDTYSIDVKIHGGSVGDVLVGWVDFDGNDSFDQREAASVTLTQEMVNAGKATLTWNGIAAITAAKSGSDAFDTYARFRIVGKDDVTSTFKVLASDGKGAGSGGGAATRDARSYGALLSGEVEDYKITIQEVDSTRPDVSTVVVTGGNGPRSTPVGEVTVRFSESVKDVDVSDFKLYRKDANGQWQEVTLPGNTPVTGGGDTWKIDLSKVTSPTGEYKLEIPGNTPGIKDFGNNNLNQGGEVIFLIDTTAPVIDLDANSPSRDWAATSTNGAAVSLDNNAAPAAVTEEGAVPGTGEITRIDIAVSGLRDGDHEMLIFGSTTLKAGGEVPGGNVTVGGHTVSITYDAAKGTFTITKPGGNFTSAEASAIVADIQYRNAADSHSTSGERSFSFTATDKAGVVATAAVARVNVTGDGTNGPQTPTVDPKVSNNPKPVVTGGAVVPPANGSTLVVTIDGETYTWTSGTDTPGTPNGNGVTYHDGNDPDPAKRYTWSVQVRNPLDDKTYPVTATVTPSGGTSVTDITTNELVIDTTPPDVPTVVSQVTNNHTPTITGKANVREGETLSVTVNGKTYTEGDGKLVRTNNTWTLTIPPADQIPDGSYPVEAKVIDAAGNVSQDITTNELVIDSVPPVIDLDPSDTGAVNHKARSVNGALVSLDDNGDAATLVEGSDQIAKIEIAVSGIVDTGGWEKIKIGNDVNLWSLGTGGTQSTNGAVAGGVTGLYIVRDSSNKFTITKTDGSTLTQAQAQAIIRDFQYQNSKGAASTMGDRTFTFTATDKAGNVSNSAVSTITVTGPLAVSSITVNEASPYAVFTVTATPGDVLTGLTLTGDTSSGKATGGGVDFGSSGSDGKVNLEISLDNGATWTSYSSGNITVPTGGASDGKVLVRTSITNDTSYEGSETFTLTVTPQTGTNATGTATIIDDGTGTIFDPKGNPTPTNPADSYYSTTGNPAYVPRDDDRPLAVTNGGPFNESSTWATFTVTALAGQELTLTLGNTAATTDKDATIGGFATQYSTDGGMTWTNYTGNAGGCPTVGSGGTVLVRVNITSEQDTVSEGAETFTLAAAYVSNPARTATDVAIIVDDGSGAILIPSGPNPNDPHQPNPAQGNLGYVTPDDDRSIAVTADGPFNEASTWATFTVAVTGSANDAVALAVQSTGAGAGHATTTGFTTMQYSADGGTTWTPYTGAAGGRPVVPAGGSGNILVRVNITSEQDTTYEGAETFALKANYVSNTDKSAAGTATIKDDGTGTLLKADGTTDTTTAKDDDRSIAVAADGPFNEASTWATFTVSALAGQNLTLTLGNTADTADKDASIGGFAPMQYSTDGGASWMTYTGVAGGIPAVAGAAGSTGSILVRVNIVSEQDTAYEGAETFTLTAAYAANTARNATGIATIVDDSTGTILIPGGTPNPAPGNPGYVTPDDDRSIAVTSPVVNEASPHAVFEVTVSPNQGVTLTLTSGTATGGGTDFGSAGAGNLEVSTDGGTTWTGYTSGSGTPVTAPADGKLLVRTPIVNDSIADDGEQFTLTAALATGAKNAVGTAAIKDDGTGNVFDGKGTPTPANPADPYYTTPGNPSYTPRDNDLKVSSPTVNEASPYAVFDVEGTPGKHVALTLNPGTATGGGVDFGTNGSDPAKPNLEYSTDGGTTWTSYTSGSGTPITVPSGGKLVVRTPIVNDNIPDDGEQFTLTVTPAGGGVATTGLATIKDDGTGDIWIVDPSAPGGSSTPGNPADDKLVKNPTDPAAPGYIAPNNDLKVSSPTVNEASPYAVFDVEGTPGKHVALTLNPGTATGGGVDFGTNGGDPAKPNLEYSTDGGTTWTSYSSGSGTPITVPTGGKLVVRTPVVKDNIPDDGEQFTLTVTPAGGGVAATGTATIKDDGTGDIWIVDPSAPGGSSTPGNPADDKLVKNPTDPAAPGYIAPSNDHVPTAKPDASESRDGRAVTVDVRANDPDPDGDPLTVTAINGTPIPPSGVVAVPGGTVTRGADGSLSFAPTPGSQGTVVVSYTVTDPQGNSATGKWTITVVPEAPPKQPDDTVGAGDTAPAGRNGEDIAKRAADDLISGDQVKDPSVFFDGSVSDGVRRMQIPLHPALYVDVEVSRMQAERAADDTRGFSDPRGLNRDAGAATPSSTSASSIGAGLGIDSNLFVAHAVREAQQQSGFLSGSVDGRYGRIDLGSDGFLPGTGLFRDGALPPWMTGEARKAEQGKDGQGKDGKADARKTADAAQGAVTHTEAGTGNGERADAVQRPAPVRLAAGGGAARTAGGAPSFSEQLRGGASRLPVTVMAPRKG